MRFVFTLLIALFALLPFSKAQAQTAFTGGSSTVSAAVPNNCIIVSAPDINFGAYSPITAGGKTTTFTFTVRCSQGMTGVNLKLSLGTVYTQDTCSAPDRRMKGATYGDYLWYETYLDAGMTQEFGCASTNSYTYPTFTNSTTDVVTTFYGKLYEYMAAGPDTYTDNLSYTLTF